MSADKDIDSSAKQKKPAKPADKDQKAAGDDFISIFEQERDDPLKPKPIEEPEESEEPKEPTTDTDATDGRSKSSDDVLSVGKPVVFEPTKPASERGLLVHALDAEPDAEPTPKTTQAMQQHRDAPFSDMSKLDGLDSGTPISSGLHARSQAASPQTEYVAGRAIQPTVSRPGFSPLPAAPPYATNSGVRPPGGPPAQPLMPWQQNTPQYRNQLNPGVQPLRGYHPPPGQTMGQGQLLPQNPYAFLNEQTLPDNTGKRKNIVLLVTIALLVIMAISGGAAVMIFGNKGNGNDPQNGGTADPTGPSGLSLSFSMIQSQFKDEILTGTITQQIIGSDGAVIMVTGVDRDYEGEGSAAPTTSNELIKVDLLLGNADSSRPIIFEGSNFVLSSMDAVMGFPMEGMGVGAQLVTLNPGMKGKMSVVYEVKPGMDDGLVLLYNRTHQDSGIRYTMFSAVGLSATASTLTPDDVMGILQSQKPSGS